MSVPARTIIGVLVSSLLVDGVLAGISSAPGARTVLCNPPGRAELSIPTLSPTLSRALWPAQGESRSTAVVSATLCGDGLSPLVELSAVDAPQVEPGVGRFVRDFGSCVIPISHAASGNPFP